MYTRVYSDVAQSGVPFFMYPGVLCAERCPLLHPIVVVNVARLQAPGPRVEQQCDES